MSNSTQSKFLTSFLTAIIVGVGIAYAGIFAVQVITKPHVQNAVAIDETIPELLKEEGEIDPTFISRFSRGFIYSAEKVIEDAGGVSLTAQVNPKISATSYIVTDIDQDIVIEERDADRLLPIASITKLVTAVVARKVFKEKTRIEITQKILLTEGDSGKFRFAEKFRVDEILFPLLMVSSNDAAEALSQTYDAEHGKGKFIKEMNAWVNSIGAYRTYFRDPSGLSESNVSTAKDISIILKWIKEHEPGILDITLTKTKSIRLHTWTNPTHFLNLSSYEGGKNGFTAEAKLTSASIFSFGKPKKYYSVVLLGSSQRDVDTLSVLNKALK